MPRYQLDENTYILGKFNTGDTVTIALYDLSDDSAEALDNNSCSEIGSTGVFKWNVSNITTTPTVYTEFLWIMNNGTYDTYGKIVMGGYVDDIDQPVSTAGGGASSLSSLFAYREETIKFLTTIRLNDGTVPAVIADVEFTIRQDDVEITAPVTMTPDSSTRYYASWTIPVNQAFGQYHVLVTATVDGGAWEQIIALIDVRENTESMIVNMYLRSLEEKDYAVQKERF